MMNLKEREFNFLEQQLKWHLHYRDSQPHLAHSLFDCIATGISELCPKLPQDKRHESFRFLFSHLDQEERFHISAEEAASLTGYSRSHFFSLFKQLYRMDFSQYLRQRRITEAKHLLISSSNKINDISIRLGYDSPAYFSKVFREEVGCSPQEYRKQDNRKQQNAID
jgi:AraC-like DNA-binding protein